MPIKLIFMMSSLIYDLKHEIRSLRAGGEEIKMGRSKVDVTGIIKRIDEPPGAFSLADIFIQKGRGKARPYRFCSIEHDLRGPLGSHMIGQRARYEMCHFTQNREIYHYCVRLTLLSGPKKGRVFSGSVVET